MDLFSKKTIKDLFKKYQTKPFKYLGQNFLIDKSVSKKIIETADIGPKDTILEIGPGIGSLTIELIKNVKKIIAIEKDPKMVEILQETLKNFKNVKIIYGDVLKIENLKLIGNWKLPARHSPEAKPMAGGEIGNYKVVANLPYYITAPVIRKFLELKNPPQEMILMVQKEMAQRICNQPSKMNILAVSVQFYAKPKIIKYISKKSFWPEPKVDGAIIKITPTKLQVCNTCNFRKLFFKIVKAGFKQPRKQILNNLSKNLFLFNGLDKQKIKVLKLNKKKKEKIKNWLLKNNIQPNQRAETLSVQDWTNLTKSV